MLQVVHPNDLTAYVTSICSFRCCKKSWICQLHVRFWASESCFVQNNNNLKAEFLLHFPQRAGYLLGYHLLGSWVCTKYIVKCHQYNHPSMTKDWKSETTELRSSFQQGRTHYKQPSNEKKKSNGAPIRKCAHMCDCKCACQSVYLHPFHVCLSTCLSVSLPACVHSSVKARKKNRRQREREEVLSVSVGWAGSWWEQEGRRLAGRSHALFRHHSIGARPLGQNTTHIFTHVNTTHTPKHTWPKSCVLQQKLPEASSANPNSILRTLRFPHTSA